MRIRTAPSARGHGPEERCFVILPTTPVRRFDRVFHDIRAIFSTTECPPCHRAAGDVRPGEDSLPKIHRMILEASLVVADVSLPRANV
jgi:hypothetical protein